MVKWMCLRICEHLDIPIGYKILQFDMPSILFLLKNLAYFQKGLDLGNFGKELVMIL